MKGSAAPFFSVRPLGHAVKALEALLQPEERTPADRLLRGYFQSHRQIGSHDRTQIGDIVFEILRKRRSLASRAGASDAHALVFMWACRQNPPLDPERLKDPHDRDRARCMLQRSQAPLPARDEADMPDWIWERLRDERPEPEARAFARAFREPGPAVLRVNTLRATRNEALEKLRANGLDAQPCAHSPWGLVLPQRLALHQQALFKDGWLEAQDEGSQFMCALVGAQPGETVIDLCAGAGGKTLAIGAMMRDTGAILACDIHERRLSRIRPRLQRAGLTHVRLQAIAPHAATDLPPADRVLVDAPCSGLGTVRRAPELKWRRTPQDIARFAETQRGLLDRAAPLVKTGGRLVYATCSFLRQENEDVADAFLSEHPEFKTDPTFQDVDAWGWRPDAKGYTRLDPAHDNTDAFFAAVFRRIA